jgi:tetratricopeptide (TPR) repeat protein
MKRFTFVLFFCLIFTSLYSQKPLVLKADGDKALKVKNYALALKNYEKALTVWGKNPTDYAMIYSMGTCAYSVNDMNKAQKYFDMCIAANNNVDMAYQYKACVMKAKKDDAGYLNTLKEGIAKVPNSKALKETLGKYYFAEGNKHYKEAMDVMKSAANQVKAGKISATDKAFKDMNDKARLDFKEALKWMDMTLGVNPNDETAKTVKTSCVNQLQMLI